jgi:streptogramin lyase
MYATWDRQSFSSSPRRCPHPGNSAQVTATRRGRAEGAAGAAVIEPNDCDPRESLRRPPPGGTRKGDAVRHRHRAVVALAATIATTAALLGPVAPASAGSASARQLFPTVISLPDGFQPEGIAIGALPFAFFGSRAGGSIYRVNLITGTGTTINPGFGAGTASLGMKVDSRPRLFVAGAGSGDGRVVNAVTGDTITTYDFTDSTDTFVNDVVLTPSAAWFTDSRQKVLYGLLSGRRC